MHRSKREALETTFGRLQIQDRVRYFLVPGIKYSIPTIKEGWFILAHSLQKFWSILADSKEGVHDRGKTVHYMAATKQ